MNPRPGKRPRHNDSFVTRPQGTDGYIEDRGQLRPPAAESSVGYEGNAQHSDFADYFTALSAPYARPPQQHNTGATDLDPPFEPNTESGLGGNQTLWTESFSNLPSTSNFASLSQQLSTLDPETSTSLTDASSKNHETSQEADLQLELALAQFGDPETHGAETLDHRQRAIKDAKFICEEKDCPGKSADGSRCFGSYADLKRHTQDVHKKDLRTGRPAQKFTCPFPNCRRAEGGFTRKQNLIHHVRTVHKDQQPPGMISSASHPGEIRAASSSIAKSELWIPPSATTSTISQNPAELELPVPLTEIEESDPALSSNYHLAKNNRELRRLKRIEFEQQFGPIPEQNRRILELKAQCDVLMETVGGLRQDLGGDPNPPAKFQERLASTEQTHRERKAELIQLVLRLQAFKNEIGKYIEQANKGVQFVLLKRRSEE